MIDIPLAFLDGVNIGQVAERVVVVAVLLLLILFMIVAITQLRLLNRFLKTPAAPVWILASVFLFLITLATGTWYFLL